MKVFDRLVRIGPLDYQILCFCVGVYSGGGEIYIYIPIFLDDYGVDHACNMWTRPTAAHTHTLPWVAIACHGGLSQSRGVHVSVRGDQSQFVYANHSRWEPSLRGSSGTT